MNTTKLPRVARRALGVALASALMMIPCTTGIAAETSVPLDAAHFPDPAFRALVQQQDSDNDGVLSSDELHSIWKIEGGCYYDDTCGNITSAAGIEYFPSLTDLDLGGNQLTSLDVSHNPQLERLFVSDNQLKSIDLSHNPALAYLTLSDNQFTSIDISHNPALYDLYADGNQLTTVDVSNHAALATLDLHNNQLTHVNLEGTPKLDYLDIDNNSVLSVDLSQNAALKSLSMKANPLTSIDLSHNTVLESLSLPNNRLTSIDLSHNTALNYLSLSNNQLTSVDLRHNTNLIDLYLDNNRLLWLGDVAKSVQFSDFSNQQFGPITDASLDLAKAAPGIDVSRISDVQGGTLQGTVLTPTSTDGLVTYDYHFSDAQMPLGVRVQFEVPSFTVAFDTNGGSGNTVISVVSGETVSAPDAPTREGYTFDGWYTAKDGGTKYDFSKPVTGDLTLYAHWTAKTTPVKITFRDVSSSTPHHEDIQWLADNGISTGWKMADGRYEFRGMSAVVRQDMAAFLRREAVKRGIGDAKTWKPTNADWNTFKDVNRGTPHAEDILWLAHAGISTGWKEKDGSSTFRGMSPVVRQDMAAFLRRLAKLGKKDGGVTPKYDFRDVKFTDPGKTPHADDIAWLAGSGISEGWKVGNAREFRGMSPVVRQDMAAFLHRLDNQLAK